VTLGRASREVTKRKNKKNGGWTLKPRDSWGISYENITSEAASQSCPVTNWAAGAADESRRRDLDVSPIRPDGTGEGEAWRDSLSSEPRQQKKVLAETQGPPAPWPLRESGIGLAVSRYPERNDCYASEESGEFEKPGDYDI